MAIPTITMEEMLDAGVHFGHQTHKWNPKMKKYIYTDKAGIHIIDIEKTAKSLNDALTFLYNEVKDGKTVLFVSTKSQTKEILPKIAEKCHMPYVVKRWLGGTLTNYPTIYKRIKRLNSLETQYAAGSFDKYTKKEVLLLEREINKLNDLFAGLKEIEHAPDILFIIDTIQDHIAVKEARITHTPIVGLTDTNADPSLIDYPIPANDDAIKSLNLMLNLVSDVISEAYTARK